MTEKSQMRMRMEKKVCPSCVCTFVPLSPYPSVPCWLLALDFLLHILGCTFLLAQFAVGLSQPLALRGRESS